MKKVNQFVRIGLNFLSGQWHPTIHVKHCLLLGWPLPRHSEKQVDYVLRLMLSGSNVNTRQCRYVGIHNLHSVLSVMKKRKIAFVVEHKACFCPLTGTTPSRPVDNAYMTFEQREAHKEKAAQPKAKATS